MVLPYKWFRLPFGVAGTLAAIPDATQPDGSVSYNEGFGPDYALDPATNPSALNIPRDKSNQLYNDITTALQYLQAGNIPKWISTADNGGVAYSYGFLAKVLYTDGYIYTSIVAANTTTPGSSSNWVRDRIRLNAAQAFYVATTGNDSTGDGSSGSPWATVTKAYAFTRDNYDLNNQIVTVNVANGTYGGWTCTGPLIGAVSPLNFQIKAASNSVVYSGGTCGLVSDSAWVTVDTGTISGGSFGFIVQDFGWLGWKNCAFGAQSSHHINSSLNGRATCYGNYSITAAAGAHLATNMGVIDISAVTVTITGTPAFSNAFAFTSGGVIYSSNNVVFSGAATGARYSSSVNGIIQTNGGGASYFPGNSAGITGTGGQYA